MRLDELKTTNDACKTQNAMLPKGGHLYCVLLAWHGLRCDVGDHGHVNAKLWAEFLWHVLYGALVGLAFVLILYAYMLVRNWRSVAQNT